MSKPTGNYISHSIKNIINLVNAEDSKVNLMPFVNSLIYASSNYNLRIIRYVQRNAREVEEIGFNSLKDAVLQKYEDGQLKADDNIATQDDKDKIIRFLQKYEECASQDKEIPRKFFLELKEFALLTEAKTRELNEAKAEALNNASGVNFDNLTGDEEKGEEEGEGRQTKHKIYAEDSDSEDLESEHSGRKKSRMEGRY